MLGLVAFHAAARLDLLLTVCPVWASNFVVSKLAVGTLGAGRRACVTALTKAEIGGPVYRGASRLTSEIDIMAEVLTGNRNQLRPCGPFGGVPKKPPPPPLTGSKI